MISSTFSLFHPRAVLVHGKAEAGKRIHNRTQWLRAVSHSIVMVRADLLTFLRAAIGSRSVSANYLESDRRSHMNGRPGYPCIL